MPRGYFPIVLALAWSAAAGPASGEQAAVALTASAAPLQRAMPRIGLNLGAHTTWGAEQLTANVLKNPGLEATLDRTLVVVGGVDERIVHDDTAWLARPDGFWSGGRYQVRTGDAAGATGRVAQSRRRGRTGNASFELDPMPSALRTGDALSITADADPLALPGWRAGAGRATPDAEPRPGSPGQQSVRLSSGADGRAQLLQWMDAIGARAGKLLPVGRGWRLAFWARGAAGGERLVVRFQRLGSPEFVRRTLELTPRWREVRIDFDGRDDGPAQTLELSFELRGGEALIDDVYLGESVPGAGGFRRDAVAVLRALRPGYLRDWQGQLGDTLANRLAEPFARRPTRYRPGDGETFYAYSLHEFFALCAAVGAQPWMVAPTLFDDAEWRALGEVLQRAAAAHGFSEVMLEFGNENWNPLFRPAGFLDPVRHAQAADRAFRLVREGAGEFGGIVPVVNAQYVDPAGWARIAAHSTLAARVAVAPYFLYRLADGSPEQARAAAFGQDDATLRAGVQGVARQDKRVAVYEVNLHTTGGNAPSALRDHAVAGSHSAAALGRRLLQGALAGVREQAVYALAGFDSFYGDQRALVRLWGVARDLAPGTLRPTGLALALLNEAIAGDLHAARCSGTDCKGVTAVFFRDAERTRLVVASSQAWPMHVNSGLACDGAAASLRLIDGSTGLDNEDGARVAIERREATCRGAWGFELPAYGIAALHVDAARPSPDATAPRSRPERPMQ